MPNRENSARVAHILGNYEIFDELGRGGMGIVYRGLDLSLDRPVAVKVLRDDLRMQPMIVSRFAREARAAASLDHPNIVQIYSVGEVQRTPYIAMELVDSEPLSALMIREGKLPWERAFFIAGQVAAALGSAHDAQIIHRDVKPPNILLGDDEKAYVTDFGIAKILSMHDQLTLDGTKLGTPQYMSPERCRTGDASASSDVYSLGVLLFQMISGRLPHEGNSATELVKRIISDPPARLRGFVPDVPEDVERLVAWMIEGRPESRPASALEARDAMVRVRAGERLDLRSSSVSSALADFCGEVHPRKSRKSSSKRSVPVIRRLAFLRSGRIVIAASVLAASLFGWGIGSLLRTESTLAPSGQEDITPWFAPKNAATFVREAEHTWIARLTDPGLQIQDIAWSDSSQSFQLLAESAEGDTAPFKRALLSINPVARHARAASLSPSERDAFFNVDLGDGRAIGFAGDGAKVSIASLESAEHDMFRDARTIRNAIADVIGESRIDDLKQCVFHPTGSRVLFVVQEPDGRERLYETNLETNGAPLASAQSISMVNYMPDGSQFAYALQDADGDVRVYLGTTGSGDPVLIRQGSASLAEGALQPGGDSMVLSNGQGELIEISWTAGGQERPLGPGNQAAWIDSERFAAIAPDTRGMMQIWEVSSNDPSARRQRSFLEGGVEGPLAVSADGAWIAALPSNENGGAMIFINVEDEPIR